CSVALSFRFPPDPQNGFSVDELNPRQTNGVWERDFTSNDGGSGQVRQEQKGDFQPSCNLGLEIHAN
ncbi:MAG: hypothetical protein WCC54_22325, partial [Pseudolabrys sp.]